MPHLNHQRGETRRKVHKTYWDNRNWKVKGFRFFRAKERIALERLRTGADPDNLVWPTHKNHNDDNWNYD